MKKSNLKSGNAPVSGVGARKNPLGVGTGTGVARTFSVDPKAGISGLNDQGLDLNGPLLVNEGTLRSRHIVVDPGTPQNIGDADSLVTGGAINRRKDVDVIGNVSEAVNPQRRRRYGR